MFSVKKNSDVNYIFQNSATTGLTTYWDASGTDIFNNNSGNVTINTPRVKIGVSAGENNQALNAIAIGELAGRTNQGGTAISIGSLTGSFSQGENAVAIGRRSGQTLQSNYAISIGWNSGSFSQGSASIAIGESAGQTNQSDSAIAIGSLSGQTGQGLNSIAIGKRAGRTCQGDYAIAIGWQAGSSTQHSNTIVLSAGTSALSTTSGSDRLFIKPIRSDISNGYKPLCYNTITSEIFQSTDKTFVIDHPIHQDKYLVHACLEGPEAGVYYRGKGVITNNTFEEIVLPDYAKIFTDFTIQVTPINSNNTYGVSEVNEGKFKVIGDNGSFFWLVHATRNTINVEPLKSEVTVNGEGPYKYIL